MSISVGFAKGEITPKMCDLPLAGYGATHLRIYNNILHPLECLVTAIQEKDYTALFVTADLINILTPEYFREAIEEATGVPEDHIIISGTHTHSAPDLSSSLPNVAAYKEQLRDQFVAVSKRALADLMPATLSYGHVDVGNEHCRFNFGRHYTMTYRDQKDDPGSPVFYAGDNSGLEYATNLKTYCYTGHAWDVDREMQVLYFSRQDADDIVWVQWQAHATVTGAMNFYNISSDYPYVLRKRLEKMLPGVKSVYMQGGAGNINPHTRIKSEGIPCVTSQTLRAMMDVEAYGNILGTYAYQALKDLTPCSNEGLQVLSETFEMTCDHGEDDRAEDAREIQALYQKEGRSVHVEKLCLEKGFNSPYHAVSVIRKKSAPQTMPINLRTVRIGDIGMICAPFELFDKTCVHIKENSPFAHTMIQAYSGGRKSYLPCKEAPGNCYEYNQSPLAHGSAEIVEANLLEMLRKMK